MTLPKKEDNIVNKVRYQNNFQNNIFPVFAFRSMLGICEHIGYCLNKHYHWPQPQIYTPVTLYFIHFLLVQIFTSHSESCFLFQ